jgi:hypothetical protein
MRLNRGIRRGLALVLGLTVLIVGGGASVPAETPTAVIEIVTAKDADVRSPKPTKSYGTYPELVVDGSPAATALVEFDLGPIAGRRVLGARLEMLVTDRSDAGGEVRLVTAPWTEAVTWKTQPAIDSAVLASIGKVSAGTVTSTALPPSVLADTRLALAITATSTDGAHYSSREGTRAPRLVVELGAAETTTTTTSSSSTTSQAPASTSSTSTTAPTGPDGDAKADGVTTVATSTAGSSDPTLFAMNQRLAVSAGGRVFALHGKHADGVQLVWRERGAVAWSNATRGSVLDGRILSGTGTGDWTASIVIGRDDEGVERAWVVMAHSGYRSSPAPVWFRSLSDLDGAGGPLVADASSLTPPDVFGKQADLAVFTAAGGVRRVAVVWTERRDSINTVRVGWLDGSTGAPVLSHVADLATGTSNQQHGSFVVQGGRASVLVKGQGGKVRVHHHDGVDLTAPWTASAAVLDVGTAKNAPHGVLLSDGSLLVAFQREPTIMATTIARFAAGGDTVAVETTLAERGMPALTVVDETPWLVAVHAADRSVVAAARIGGSWNSERVLVDAATTASSADSPNVLRPSVDGRIRFIVRGASGANGKYAVLASQSRVV